MNTGFSHPAVRGRPFLTLLRYNRRYWRPYTVGAVCGALLSGISLAALLLVRGVVAQFESGTLTSTTLLLFLAGLVGASLVGGVARFIQRIYMIGASRRFEYDLRNDYFAHIQQLGQRFFRRTPTGDVMARATNDINYVREFIGPGVMYSVDMMRVPVALGAMLYFSPRLTGLSLLPLPVLGVILYFFIRFLTRQSKRVQEQFARVTARAQENLAGARVVKAFGMAAQEEEAFRIESTRYMRENIKLTAVMSTALPLLGAVVGAIIVIILWQGGSMVIREEIMLADLTTFIFALFVLAVPIAQFGYVLSLYQRGAVAMNRIADLMNVAPEIGDNTQTNPDATIDAGHIAFEGVTFAYEQRPAIVDISFEVPGGQMLAIAGATGSGKSTIAALISREYDPSAGTVYLDEHDLRTVPLRELRRKVSVVPQDSFVFSDSIRANVCLGRPEATEDELRAACEVAQFDADVADMPAGYDTLLGERGINLSGGQKQRLAIARAVMLDPHILVLDDALSSVDTNTEERILQGLRRFLAGRTCVIIAHRCSTLRYAQQILYVEDGRIAERGTHEALLQADGHYAAMWRRQQLEAELEQDA